MVLPVLVPLLLLLAAPLAAPLPGPCLPGCTIEGQGLLGFIPPVVLVQSGATVTWRGLDYAGHINYEGLTNFDEGVSCFVARYADKVRDSATFRLEDGVLFAEQAGVEKVCTFAVPLPGGAALLPYQCVLHPIAMKGALVVAP